MVYIFSIILLFGLPLTKFKNKKVYVGTIFTITSITLFINIFWSFISPENPVSPVGQMEYLKNIELWIINQDQEKQFLLDVTFMINLDEPDHESNFKKENENV